MRLSARRLPSAAPLLVLVMLGAGCSSGPLVRDAPEAGPSVGYPNHSAETILDSVRVPSVTHYAADGRLQIDTPEGTQNASHSIRAQVGDSLSGVIRGPLGILVARALVTPDSFFLANRLRDEAYVGAVRSADRLVPGAGSEAVLARALIGLIHPDPSLNWQVTPASGRYVLRAETPDGGRQAITIDPSLWRAVSVRTVTTTGDEVEQIAEAFDTVDGFVLPRRIILRQPSALRTVTIEHTRLRINPDELRIASERPAAETTIRVE